MKRVRSHADARRWKWTGVSERACVVALDQEWGVGLELMISLEGVAAWRPDGIAEVMAPLCAA